MLFVTNRRLRQGPSPSVADGDVPAPRPVDFDIDDSEPSSSVHFRERNDSGACEEIYSGEFLKRLKESSARQVLLYIHGFSNLPEDDIFPRTAILQGLCDEVRPGDIEVVALIWPCDNDLGILIVSRRLGHTGPERMEKVPGRVYAIDCDDFDNTLDPPSGHPYFLRDDDGHRSPVFNHMMRSMVTGRVDADDRTRTAILNRNYGGGLELPQPTDER